VSLLKSAANGNLTLTQLTTPLLTTATNIDLVINPAGAGAVQFPNDQTLRTSSFDSSFPINGFQINEVPGVAGYSAMTIGKIQADELAVRVFVADEVRVDRGDEFWTKSYGIVAETFTSPGAVDGTVSVKFEDSPALAGAIFVNDDWVLFRKLEITTGISLFNLWGQVSSYVNNSDGTQNWTFTLKSGPLSAEILKGSLAIDFGASGAALIHLSVIDAAGAPYIKMRKWAGANPYTPANFTTYVQIGHLGSIGNAYYTPSGYGLYIRSTAAEDQFMVADDNGLQIRGASLSLYNGANQTILINNASGMNFDEDLWGSWDNRRAMQWWPDVASMSGDPSLSIYTGKASGGFTNNQNFSYIDANPTGGVLAGLSVSAFGQGTGTDALLYLEGGSQSLATGSSATVTADAIELVGTPILSGTGSAQNFNPKTTLTYNLGTASLEWSKLYVEQIIVSGSISGSTLSGQEWEYAGSMTIDANSASNTIVSVVNQGTGSADLDVDRNITLGGTVDGVDLSGFKTAYDTHVGNIDAHHAQNHVIATTSGLGSNHTVSGLTAGQVLRALSATDAAFAQLGHSDLSGLTTGDPHTQYLLKAGGTITGNVTVSASITIDGVDISAHAADVNAHHARQHAITSTSDHTATGAALDLFGLTAVNTLGMLTPSASPGAASAILKSDGAGLLTLPQLTATTRVRTPLIDTTSGNLTIAPAGGVTAITGALTVSTTGAFVTSLSAPSLITASGNLSINPAGGTTAITGALTGSSTAAFTTNVSTPIVTAAANLTLSPTSNLILSPVVGFVGLTSPVSLRTDNYSSQFNGWNIAYDGGADFRHLFVDELHAKSFIADLEQALAGGQIISKSVAVLAVDFVVPNAGATATLTVEDLPSAADMAVFQANDIVRLRSFNRDSGSLTIGDCWGTVTSYADIAGGRQTWTFTRSGTTTYNTITQRGTATQLSSSAATSRAPAKPTGVVAGDALFAVVAHDGSADTVTAPAGWTAISYTSGTDINVGIYTKFAGASEGSTYSFSTVNSHALSVAIVAYFNVDSLLAYDDFSIQANAASTSMPAASVNASTTANRLLFFGGITNNSAATPPASMTELSDAGSTGIRTYIADQLLTASGATGTKTATISATHASVAAMITLRPTDSGTPAIAGTMIAGSTVAAKSLVLDYGVSGNGFHEVNAIDGAYGANSPYSQVVNWTGHPQSGSVVRTRMGNLFGITSTANEYGLYAGDGGIAATSQFLRVSNAGVQLNNIPIKLYNAGVQTVNIDSAGVDIWVGPSSADKRLTFNGTTLGLNSTDIKMYNSGTQTVNISSAGTDIWVGPSSADKRISWNGSALALKDSNITMTSSGTEFAKLDTTNGLDFKIGTSAAEEQPAITWRSTIGAGSPLSKITSWDSGTRISSRFEVIAPNTTRGAFIDIAAYNADTPQYVSGIAFDIGATGNTALATVYGDMKFFNGDIDMNDNNITGAGRVSAGSVGIDYTPTVGNWQTSGSTLLLNGLNYTTIGFHDSVNRVDFIRVGAGLITLGYDGGFGVANVAVGGTIKTALNNPWDLGSYTATAPAATGYVTIKINGTTYKLLAST
jgi:hypothetical protein